MSKKSVNLLVFLLAFLAFLPVMAQEGTVSVTTESKWHRNRVDVAYMNKRISDAAEEYKEYAPIPRIAFYDLGFPKDKAEFEQLNGYGVLLISAMSQTESELPLKRVYVTVEGEQIELKLLKQFLSKESDPASRTVKTFGFYRVDALYIFPVYLRMKRAEVLILP